MKWCVLVYKHSSYEEHLGVFNFQQLPRIGETIKILNSGTYKVVDIVYEFLGKPTQDVAKENRVIIYVE